MHAAGADPVLDMLAELQGAARDRLTLAYAPKSKGALRSALRKFGHFSRYDICPRALHAEKRRFWKGRMNTRIADLFGLYVLEAMPTTQINM